MKNMDYVDAKYGLISKYNHIDFKMLIKNLLLLFSLIFLIKTGKQENIKVDNRQQIGSISDQGHGLTLPNNKIENKPEKQNKIVLQGQGKEIQVKEQKKEQQVKEKEVKKKQVKKKGKGSIQVKKVSAIKYQIFNLNELPGEYSITKTQIEKMKEQLGNKQNKILLKESVVTFYEKLPTNYCITKEMSSESSQQTKQLLPPSYFIVKLREEDRKQNSINQEHFNSLQTKTIQEEPQFDPFHFDDPKIIHTKIPSTFKKAKTIGLNQINQPQETPTSNGQTQDNIAQQVSVKVPTTSEEKSERRIQIVGINGREEDSLNLREDDQNHNQIHYPQKINNTEKYLYIKLCFSILLILAIVVFVYTSPNKAKDVIKLNVVDDERKQLQPN